MRRAFDLRSLLPRDQEPAALAASRIEAVEINGELKLTNIDPGLSRSIAMIRRGTLVRVSPSACPRGRSRHFGRAIVVAIAGSKAWIKPFGRHRKLERVDLTHLHVWKARN